MTTKTTITEIAHRLIDPITGGGTLMNVQVDEDHYELSEFGGQSDLSQIVSSAHIVTGLCAWAGRTLADTKADAEERSLAAAVGVADWETVENMLNDSSSTVSVDIWDSICEVGVECDDVRGTERVDPDTVNPVDDPEAFNEMPPASEQN